MADRFLLPPSVFVDWAGDSVAVTSDPSVDGHVAVVADDNVQLTPDQADDMAAALHAHAARVRAAGGCRPHCRPVVMSTTMEGGGGRGC